MRRRCALALLLGVLAVVPAAGAEAGSGAIVGVVRTADGDPAPHARVEAWRHRSNGHWRLQEVVRADAAGRYTLAHLHPGEVWLAFDDAAPPSRDQWAREWWRDSPTVAGARPTTVRAGATVRRSAVLDPGGTITGRVTRPGGEPAAGASVAAYLVGDVARRVAAQVQAGDDGSYALGGLAAGDYRIGFGPRYGDGDVAPEWFGDSTDRAGGATVSVPAGGTVTGIDDELPAAGHVTGTFTTSDGGVLSSPAELVRFAAGSWRLAGISYDPPHRFDGLAAGRYRLYVFRDWDQTGYWWPHAPALSSAQDIVVTEGATVSVSGQSEVGASIAGTVRGPHGKGRVNSPVAAYRRDSAGAWVRIPFYDSDSELGTYGTERTGDGGHYTIRGLLPGRYRVEFADRDRSRVVRLHPGERVTGVDTRLDG